MEVIYKGKNFKSLDNLLQVLAECFFGALPANEYSFSFTRLHDFQISRAITHDLNRLAAHLAFGTLARHTASVVFSRLILSGRSYTETMLPLLRPPRLDLDELAKIQKRIAGLVKTKDGFSKLGRIAGCDMSFASGDIAYAACAVLDYQELNVLEKRVRKVKLKFPYIPTFLSFRELDGLLKVTAGVAADVFMVGAQGLAHPRRAGLACHIGVVLDRPTLGVAKSRLIGEAETPANRKGAYTLLKDGRDIVGAVVRTQLNSKPVYVSVGHKLALKTATKIALATSRGHRLPKPLLVAHRLATEAMHRSF